MFDFAWSELAVIGVVALLVIGPKDLPKAIKMVGEVVRKARRMASEFQTHVDDMVKDANLQEVRDQIAEIRNFDIKGAIEKEIDRDGSIRSAFDNPLDTSNTPTPLPAAEPSAGDPLAAALAPPDALAPVTAADLAAEAEDPTPAFIPPAIAHPPAVPDFLPPATHRPQPGL
jgi:sec-independent protein translocase protein TatB